MPHFDDANVNRADSYVWVSAHQDELVSKRIEAAKQMTAKHDAEQAARGRLRLSDGPGPLESAGPAVG